MSDTSELVPLIQLNNDGESEVKTEDSIKNSKDKTFLFLNRPACILMLSFIFLESVFHFIRFGATADNLGYKVLFGGFYGVALGYVFSLLPRIATKILTWVTLVIVTIYYIAQIIYSGVFNTYLSISGTFNVAGQALDFTDVICAELKREWWKLLILLIPLVCLIIIGKRFVDYGKLKVWSHLISPNVAIAFFAIAFFTMIKTDTDIYSPYQIFAHYSSVDMSTQKLGVSETFVLDASAGIKNAMGRGEEIGEFSNEDNPLQEEGDPMAEATRESVDNILRISGGAVSSATGIDTSPNVLDIDFDELIANETNQNIISLHEYIASVEPTNKNQYTGMFEGYNLIFISAEGFSGYVIDKDRTPMLYELSREGFYFKNYYTPLWYGSTLGGEYANLTGLMPKNGGYLSMEKSGANKNDMMFTLGQQLLKKGYTVKGYHANDYTYYDRQISHTNMGYDWVGVGNGYEPEVSSSGVQLWPQSDLRLVQNTFDLYAEDEPFHTYYMTVSGHVMYNFGGNAMAAKHKNMVEDLDYNEDTKAYIACQYELELMLEELVADLEDAGIADRTLIVLSADHVPYNDKAVVDDLAGKELENEFEWYKNTLIIWSASMKEGIEVDKVCSSLDILPTVSNLMGLPYDSRMMVGTDILSDSEPLVMFNDRSFITDKCSYNASNGEVKSFGDANVSDEYVEKIKTIVSNKFNMAQGICDYDYYRYIDEALQN